MANVLIEENTMSGIANAIRTKNGKSDLYLPSEMSQNIALLGNAQINLDEAEEWLNGTRLNLDNDWSSEGATYGYKYIDASVYGDERLDPMNKGQHNSFAYAKITFKINNPCDLTVSMYQSSEPKYDYGFLSQLDTMLNLNHDSTDSNGVNLGGSGGSQYGAKGKSGDFTYTYEDVPKGEHFITIKYRKDGSTSEGSDVFRIKGIVSSVSQVLKEKYYITDNSDTPTKFDDDIKATMESNDNLSLEFGEYDDFNEWKNHVKNIIEESGGTSNGIPVEFVDDISTIPQGSVEYNLLDFMRDGERYDGLTIDSANKVIKSNDNYYLFALDRTPHPGETRNGGVIVVKLKAPNQSFISLYYAPGTEAPYVGCQTGYAKYVGFTTSYPSESDASDTIYQSDGNYLYIDVKKEHLQYIDYILYL